MVPGSKSAESDQKLGKVKEAIITEILRVMGLKDRVWKRKILEVLLKNPISQMAEKLVRLDDDIAGLGWSTAMKGFLADFVTEYRVRGGENVLRNGALLIVGNHPGSYDMPILSTVLRRDDLKVITSDISIVRHLPNIMEHFIFISRDPHKSMLAVRSAIRHLQHEGAVLIFPRGEVEPDMDVTPGGKPDFKRWSSSPEVFLRKVPRTKTLAVFTRGVLSPGWFKSPWVRMWRKPARRQKVAEVFQVAQQLIGKGKFFLTPCLSFSPLLTVADLGTEQAPPGFLMQSLIREVRVLMESETQPAIGRKV